MTQLLGTSRMNAGFENQVEADVNYQNMLTLYKQPATIRSMQQVFFYVESVADLVYFDPLTYYWGLDPLFYTGTVVEPPTTMDLDRYPFAFMRNPWYGFIGTKKRLNIIDKVNGLLDIRVPKDKYVFEINLAEAVIEADPENWTNLPDQVIRRGIPLTDTALHPFGIGNPTTEYFNINVDKTYRNGIIYADNAIDEPPRIILNGELQQATKLSEPQTLYCRIEELSNGEPYNWAITNSGNYSIDKGHQLLVRHGDIVASNLTLEFGHMVFTGDDEDVTIFSSDDPIIQDRTRSKYTQKQRYQSFEYLDYNFELFNAKTRNWPHLNFRSEKLTTDPGKLGGLVTMIDDPIQYARFYFGKSGIDKFRFRTQPEPAPFDPADRNVIGLKIPGEITLEYFDTFGEELITPPNRPPFVTQFIPAKSNAVVTTTPIIQDEFVPYLIQGKPLLFNQQASKIGFRFMIRVINLF